MGSTWVKTAWALESGDALPWLVAAYDESTFENWGKEPDFYTTDLAKCSKDAMIRECYIRVDMDAIVAMFFEPTFHGQVTTDL